MSGVPSITGFGEAVFTIAISAELAFATITVALALLFVRFGTMFVAFAVTVFVMFVPDAVFEFTCNTSVKLAVLPAFRLAPSVHVIVPVPPTGGSVPQVHPAGGVMDWNVVLGGVTSVMLTPVAAAGPRFFTVCV